MRESVVEKKCCKWAASEGWLVRKLSFPGNRAAPDRLFIKSGRCVFVEFKAPGEVARPDQKHEHKLIMEKGCDVLVIDNFEECVRMFQLIEGQLK